MQTFAAAVTARSGLGVALLMAVSCFEPKLPAEISCPAGACPPGLACGPDQICRRVGGGNDDAGAAIDSGLNLPCVDEYLGSSFATVNGTTVDAENDWLNCEGESAPDVTFAWTAPAGGSFEFDTCGSDQDFDTVLGAFNDCSSPPLDCNDDFDPCDLASKVSVELVEGQTVVVVVDGLGRSAGTFKLNVSQSN